MKLCQNAPYFNNIIEKQNIPMRQKSTCYRINTDKSLMKLKSDVIKTLEIL